MTILQSLGVGINHMLNDGIGPLLNAHAAPGLYHFVLAGLVVVLLNFLGHLTFDRQQEFGARLGEHGVYFLVQVLGIYAIWLAFTTPVTRLFSLAPAGVVMVIAALIHGALSLGGPLAIILATDNQIVIPHRFYAVVAIVGSGLVVFGWEIERWPALLLVAGELLLIYFITAPDLIYGVTRWASRQYTLVTVVRIVGLGAVVALHPIVEPFLNIGFFVNLFCLYVLFTLLEELARGMLGSLRGTDPDEFGQKMPIRYFLMVPLALCIGLLGARLVFAAHMRNPGLTPTVWIDASVAAAIYLVFRPLTDWAILRAQITAFTQAHDKFIEANGPAAYQQMLRATYAKELQQRQSNRGFGLGLLAIFNSDVVEAKERQEAETEAEKSAQAAVKAVEEKAVDVGFLAMLGVKSPPSMLLVFFVAVALFALISDRFGLTLAFGNNWAPLINWFLGLTAARLPFVGMGELEDGDGIKSIFGAMNLASLRIVSIVGLAVAALDFALPTKGVLASTTSLLARFDPASIVQLIDTIHVMGWVATVLVIVGYAVYLIRIYSSRKSLRETASLIKAQGLPQPAAVWA